MLTVVQMLPALDSGGVERGTVEIGRYLVAQGHRSIVVSAGGRMVEQLLAEGSEHVAWPVGRKRLPTLRYVRRVRELLRETAADVLHLRSRLPAWIGYLAWRGLPAGARPHLVTTVHGPYSVSRYSAVMTRGERVIAVSGMIREYIVRNYPGVDPGRIRVIHRGVDPTVYAYGYRPSRRWLDAWYASYPQTRGRFLVTLPARLTRWKGQEDFITVVQRLLRLGVPVHGLLVGGAHPRKRRYRDELAAQIRSAGLEDRLSMLGHRDDMQQLLAVSDVVLSLSREPEAFGRTTIEALSMGRPVIGYDHGGVAEQLASVLPEGLLPVGDVTGVAGRLAAWYRNPPKVPAEHPFTLAAMQRQTLDVYLELLGANDGPR